MPVTNVIDAIQQRYAAQTWSGKPDTLWFETAWPRNSAGTLISFPIIKFTHDGTPHDSLFQHAVLQHWRFTFQALGASVQVVDAVYAGVMWDGQDPTASPYTGSGLWCPPTMTLPTAYTFKHLIPTDQFRIEQLDQLTSPTGEPLCRVTWGMELFAHRTSFS